MTTEPEGKFTLTLPDGRRVTLTKPWDKYSVAEFRQLGLVPNMSADGTADTVSGFVPFNDI